MPESAQCVSERAAGKDLGDFAGGAFSCLGGGRGLFVRSLVNLTNVDTGFNKENVIRLRVDASSAGYKEDVRLTSIYQQIEERVNSLPECVLLAFRSSRSMRARE